MKNQNGELKMAIVPRDPFTKFDSHRIRRERERESKSKTKKLSNFVNRPEVLMATDVKLC